MLTLTLASAACRRYFLLRALYTCVYNARQYSVVKDLDCLSNQFTRDSARMNSLLILTAHTPLREGVSVGWWAQMESNHRPHPYQGCALAI